MLFSIITICFNSEKTIERTIKSVLTQTFADYEYIIVDGGSRDSTLDIVKKYEPLFEGRMKWKSESDRGIYDAMNKGIMRSSGTIIGIVNSDDWLDSEALDVVAHYYNKNHFDSRALYCGSINFYHKSNDIKLLSSNINAFYSNVKWRGVAGVRHPATFVPQKIYDEIGLFDTNFKIAADSDFLLRCYRNGYNFIEIPKALSNMSDGGVSNSFNLKIFKQMLHDRTTILKNYGDTGISYLWQQITWYIRVLLKQLLISLKLYSVS